MALICQALASQNRRKTDGNQAMCFQSRMKTVVILSNQRLRPPCLRELRRRGLRSTQAASWVRWATQTDYRCRKEDGVGGADTKEANTHTYLAKHCPTSIGCLTKQRTSITGPKTYKIKRTKVQIGSILHQSGVFFVFF